MKYPPAGSYVVVKTPGWGAQLIRWGTHSWANHAFIMEGDGGWIIEAEPGGVRRGHINSYAGCRMAANLGEHLSLAESAAVCQKAQSLVGVAYNDVDIFNLGLEALGVFWGSLARYANMDGALICSQLVAVCGQAAGIDWLCGKKNPAEVTPANLAQRPHMLPLEL